MKRSDRMNKLLKINKQQEYKAASAFASVSENHLRMEVQLTKLEEYWAQYSAQLDELKKSTASATELRDYQLFLAKINEAIALQKADIDKNIPNLEEAESELIERRIEVEKIGRAVSRILDQEIAVDLKKARKEFDELYANSN